MFGRLHKTRTYGWSADMIRMTEIVAILDLYNIIGVDDRISYMKFISAMDETWMTEFLEEKKRKKDKKNANSKRSHRRK